MPTSLENTTTIEYLQDHATELVESVSGSDEPLFITVAGQPKAVLVDVEEFREYKEYKERQKGEALLKILNDRYDRAERDGTFLTVDEAFDDIERSMGWK